ncbi:MAG: GrpB family protein [Saprospiraceae bacterium]|nr:GrpB family protein [Saprospiraceae bacterium]
MKHEFKILAYDSNWKELYLKEKENLVKIFNSNLNSIHHIGSTAIPTTKAKPEIDILIVVKEDLNIEKYNPLIEKLGYVVRGECLESGGTPGRFYYSKDINNKRTHKLHICKIGHADILSKLIFVKYLNNHKKIASEYAKLKIDLSVKYNYGRSIEKYLMGKSNFITKVLNMARTENKEWKYEDFL